MTERKNTSGTMQRNYIFGAYPERSRRKPALETGNAFFASRMDLRDYYAYARYYNPLLGRFMSPDPLGGSTLNPQSLNRYTYVLNNPETFTDPSGESCQWVFQIGTGMVLWCVTYHYSDNPKDSAEFFSEATGPNAEGIWWTPPPPPDAFLAPLAQNLEKRLRALRKRFGPPIRHLVSCTFTGKVGVTYGETALDAVGIIPGGNDIVGAAQIVSAIGATAVSVFGDVTGGGLSMVGAGLEIAKETGTLIAVHGVELVPTVGNFVSAGATIHDVIGGEGMTAAYKSCMSGGG